MSRQARRSCEYAHVIVRGIGRQILFEDDSDRYHYLSLMKRYRDNTGISVLAYCLMENHVHMLLKDTDNGLPLFMKKIGISYAAYFNKKYDRVGHLFQDRYKSEAIVNDEYLLAVYRYILKNPEKAGVSSASSYRWSSFREYGKTGGLTDTSMLCEMIGSKNAFSEFMAVTDTTEYMESEKAIHDDVWAKAIIDEVLEGKSAESLKQLPKYKRNEELAKLRERGLSIKQLERLTGIGRGIIEKQKCEKNCPC